MRGSPLCLPLLPGTIRPGRWPGAGARAAWFPGPGLLAVGTQARGLDLVLGSQEQLSVWHFRSSCHPDCGFSGRVMWEGPDPSRILGQEEFVRLSGWGVGASGQ